MAALIDNPSDADNLMKVEHEGSASRHHELNVLWFSGGS